MCDGKRVDEIDSRGVAAARACRVVSGVSSSGKRGAARGGGESDNCRRKVAAGGFAEMARLPGGAGGFGSCYMIARKLLYVNSLFMCTAWLFE
jgi:hypothetical protein